MESSQFKNGKIHIWKERFAIVKSKRPLPNSFAVIQDKNEITCIIDQNKVKSVDILAIEKEWRIITFDIVMPFGLVGFLAEISSALAKEKISIFAISSFSTDHILVKENDLQKALKVLEKLGFIISPRPPA